jgi:hypothetical protein
VGGKKLTKKEKSIISMYFIEKKGKSERRKNLCRKEKRKSVFSLFCRM